MGPTERNDRGARKQPNTKIYLQRDYSEGTSVKFQEKYPLELEGKVSRQVFDRTIQEINTIFMTAERNSVAAYTKGCLACITGYLVYTCVDTHYDKCMKRLAQFIHEENENEYIPRGLIITNPMERGLRVIEITIVGGGDVR